MGWVNDIWVEDQSTPVPWDASTWNGGSFQGASGDSSGTFVSAAEQAAAAQQAPSWLAPQDYAANGFTPEGQSTQLALAIPQSNPSQLSANPDPTQAFNFVANPNVTANNPFASSINNAYQSLLGRPATAAEIASNSQMLQQKPDDYGIFLNNLASSPEAAAAAAAGKQNLIDGTPARIDPTGEHSQPAVDSLSNTLSWLSSSYPNYTPTPNMGGIQGFANKYGPYLPAIAAAIATFGASAPASAAEIAAESAANYGGAIANGGTAASLGESAAGSAGAAGAAASNSYYDQLVNAFSNPNELAAPYASTAGANVTIEGAPSIYNDYGATTTPLVNATGGTGNAASGGLDLGSNFTWNGLPVSQAVAGTGLTIGQILSGAGGTAALASLLGGTTGGGVGGTGTGGVGTGTGSAGIGTGGVGTGTGGGGTGGGTNGTLPKVSLKTTLPQLLRSPTLYQSAPGGLYKGNQTPFMFAKEQPVQNARQSYDPFAALNVPQTPLTETPNLLAQALRQG